MSRHRNVRSMNYSDEYDGYDDVYGHSVEDDYCVSPSAEQFLFDRNKQQNISSFFTEPDIKEDNEEEAAAEAEQYTKPQLNDLELAKLASCIEAVRNVIGDTISEASLTEKIIKSDFNAEIVLDAILKETSPKSSAGAGGPNKSDRFHAHPGFSRKTPTIDSSDTKPSFTIPKLAFGSKKNPESPKSENSTTFSSLSALMANHEKSSSSPKKSQEFTSPKSGNSSGFSSLSALMANHGKSSLSSSSPRSEQSKKSFGTLADLTAHHLQKSNGKSEAPENFKIAGNSPKASFVIPKFSSTRGSSTNRTIVQSLQFFASPPRDSIVSLEKSVSKVHITEDFNKENSGIEKDENSHQGRTSPDDLTIDLTAALRQNTIKPSLKSKKVDKKTAKHSEDISTDNGNDIVNIEDVVPQIDYAKFISGLECKLNLSHLRHVRLNHSNRNLSPFGKMLCKRWKSRKPQIQKIRQPQHHTKKIVRFDFSTPSPDSLILSRLRRR